MHTQHSYVTSEPYSRVPGDRNWRHRVVDMDVFVRGPLHMLPRLQEVLKGKNIDVDGLTVRTCFILYNTVLYTYFYCLQFGPFDRHGEQQHVCDDDVKTSTTTETETTVAGNPTTKTKTSTLTMDDFWDMIFP